MAMSEPAEGDIRIFSKSGNPVRLLERYGAGWNVERVTGTSVGKQMWCPTISLLQSHNYAQEKN